MTFSTIKSSMICYRVSYTYDCRISKTKDSRIKGLSMHGKLTMLKTNHLNSSIQQIHYILFRYLRLDSSSHLTGFPSSASKSLNNKK